MFRLLFIYLRYTSRPPTPVGKVGKAEEICGCGMDAVTHSSIGSIANAQYRVKRLAICACGKVGASRECYAFPARRTTSFLHLAMLA